MAQISLRVFVLFTFAVATSHGFFKWENCVSKSNDTIQTTKSSHTCEDKDDVTLTCKRGFKISILKVFFGHGNGYKTTCDTSSIGQDCDTEGALQKVKYLCQDKIRCTIQPTAKTLGTPSCSWGLEADLFVDYTCNPVYVPDTVFINSLEISPSPLVLPGTVNVSASISIKRHLVSTTKLKLDLQKKVGLLWVPIPCVSDVGSCTYDNFCELLRGLMFSKCDRKMENKGIPCDCPIPTGTFSVPTQSIPVTKEQVDQIPVWNGLVEGQYWAKVEFLDFYDRQLGCFSIQVELDINSKKKRNLHSKASKKRTLHMRKTD